MDLTYKNYTNENLNKEKQLVTNYFYNRAQLKQYPHTYYLSMLNVINEIYEICTLTVNKERLQNPSIEKALQYATKAHNQQKRKFIDLPYIIHPIEMASMLSNLDGIEDEQIIAALLHDVVEDCNIKLEEIEKEFGSLVTYYVNFLTDPAKLTDGNREVRMNINFTHFFKSNNKTKEIKITDLLSNTRSIVICDAQFCSVYVPHLENTTNHLKESTELINKILIKKLIDTTEISKKILNLQTNFNIIKKDRK